MDLDMKDLGERIEFICYLLVIWWDKNRLNLPYSLILAISKLLIAVNPNTTSSFTPFNIEIIGNDHFFDISKVNLIS